MALIQEIEKVASHSKLIEDLGNKNMQKRHWDKVFALLPEQDRPQNIK